MFHSLYGRISALFVVLLLLFGMSQLWFGFNTVRRFAQESDQGLYKNLAVDLAPLFQPALRTGMNKDAISGLIHDMMVYNPRVEIYLLDDQGSILSYFPENASIEIRRVDMAPIRLFLGQRDSSAFPLLGDDPRNQNQKKPFSAAPLNIGGRQGILYLILGGEQYQSVAGMVGESYIIRYSLFALLASFLAIGLAGLTLFFLLTKRLRGMASTIRDFEQGQISEQLVERPLDEIGQLARAFNDMAGKVSENLRSLRHSESLRRELLANVSHDLRSPLSSIQGYLESILMKEEGELTPETRRQFLEIIYNNILRLNVLINELFELSKLEAHQVQANLEAFSLSELAHDVVLKFHPQALERHINLAGDIPPHPARVHADIAMMERVLSNLIDNALRYTPRGGTVRLTITPAGDSVWVGVTDTGAGITLDEQERVFDRFYRVDKSRSRASGGSGGSGLGLAIVKHILEIHGARIAIDSKPHQGSTLSFELPLAYIPQIKPPKS